MILDYSVSNYKIHKEPYQFEFCGLNLFTGTNNSGKTSLVQSIRVLQLWIENRIGYNYLPIEKIDSTMQINDILNKEVSGEEPIIYDFVLGDGDENNPKLWVKIEFLSSIYLGINCNSNIAVMTRMNLECNNKKIVLILDEEETKAGRSGIFKVFRVDEDGNEVSSDFRVSMVGMNLFPIGIANDDSIQIELLFLFELLNKYMLQQKMTYIAPFRAVENQMSSSASAVLEPSGINAAEILERYKNEITYDGKSTVYDAFIKWTGRIMGLDIQTRINGNHFYFVQIEEGIPFRLNQTGLGISQLIPCILSVLLSKRGDIVFIENPEVHLHPKWKTALVDFYLEAISYGVQIIVETQSLEIVNRVRRRAKESERVCEATKIWFFEKKGFECNIDKIEIKKDGGLDYWPEEFVDKETLEDSMALL